MVRLMCGEVLTVLLLSATAWQSVRSDNTQCRMDVRGKEYIGTISHTMSGLECQRWDTDNDPHSVTSYADYKFPEGSKTAAANFCRNPDSSEGPWCYTKDPTVRWELCDIPFCYGIVDSVSPRNIGQNGGVRITIYGRGFAKNQFNFGDDGNLGNRVWLVSDFDERECEVFPDGSTEEMIQCYTPPLDNRFAYHVRISVDGKDSPDSHICNGDPTSYRCSVYLAWWTDARLTKIVPSTGPPDTVVTIYGAIFTDKYGNNVASASNGREEAILRAYVGGQNCELKNDDEFYGMKLDSSTSNWGYIKCKIRSTFVTNSNITVVIDAPYGKTNPDDEVFHIAGGESLYMFQSYAVIGSISPNSGSVAGGQLITITGQFFDETTKPASVLVGGVDCAVESLTETEITCRTPAKPDMLTPTDSMRVSYPGNRGMYHDFYNESTKSFSALDELLTREDMVETFWTDGPDFCEDSSSAVSSCYLRTDLNGYNVRSRGYFIPPKDGEYQFYIKIDDQAVLYFSYEGPEHNKTKIAWADRYTKNSYRAYDTQYSEKLSLEAGKPYYFEVLFYEGWLHATSYVGVAYSSPNLVETVEGRVQPEVQTVELSSQVDDEEIRVQLTGLVGQAKTSEVQQIDVSFSSDSGTFQLAMNKAQTDVLDVDTDALKLEKAINDLPTVYPERVSVTETTAGSTKRFTVTFNSDLGDWPEFTKVTSQATVTVTEVTKGVASLNKWRLQLSGTNNYPLLSDMINSRTPSAEQMEEAITSLFSARCPQTISSPNTGVAFFEGYESANSPGRYSGAYDQKNEPYCGRSSSYNGGQLLRNSDINLDTYKYVCFAYKGEFKPTWRIRLYGKSNIWHTYNDFVMDNQWHYLCEDLRAIVQLYYAETGLRLYQFEVYRDFGMEFWVDEVYFGGVMTTEFPEKMPSRRVSLPMRLDDISVVANDTANYYDITMSFYQCANNLKMIQVYNAEVAAGSTGTGSSSVTYGGGASWPSTSEITITRSLKASPPVTGTWSLTYNGTTMENIASDISEVDLKNRWDFELGLTEVKVTKSGSCFGYNYAFQWTQTSGDQMSITVDGSGLAGNTPAIENKEIDGHLFFDPLPGDVVRTREDNPQVTVSINGIASRCDGDCSYSWEDSMTPTITGVSPTTAVFGDALTISGTSYSDTTSDLSVTIGGVACDVTASTSTEITCTLGASPVGSHDIVVNVSSMGQASGSVTIDVGSGAITSISPETSSVGGGILLTISGYGFTDTTTATVAGTDCPIDVETRSSSQLVCTVPAGSTGSVTVSIDVDGTAADASTLFTYGTGADPEVSSVSPSSAPVKAGTEITIVGSNFGSSASAVTLTLTSSTSNEVYILAMNSSAFTSTQITANLPSLSPDDYVLDIFVDGVGKASFSGSQTITVTLRVDVISANKGSMEGGSLLTIVGEGFGTGEDDVVVMLGDSECDVQSISNTEIACMTGRGSKTVVVDNSGIHQTYGLGYAWNPAVATIQQGDIIDFRWSSPHFVTSNLFKVVQTADATSEPDGLGFDSGAGSANGHFEHQFNEIGEYFYTSGFIEAQKRFEMRGKIVVEAKKSLLASSLSVTVSGVQAKLNEASGVTWSDSSSCAGVTSDISSCTDDSAATGSSNFEFAYDICQTPVVSNQDVTMGSISDSITLTGSGFSTTECDNKVKFGDFTCVPSSQTDTKIVCALDSADEPDVGISYPIEVRIHNRGYPLYTYVNRTYAVLPEITAISPTTGSLQGGTRLTITGSGFKGDSSNIDIKIGASGSACVIVSVTYTEVVCVTEPSSEFTDDVIMLITNANGNQVPVTCSSSCSFSYDTASTPTVTFSGSAPTISGASTDIALSGSNLGADESKVSVTIGDNDCVLTVGSLTDTAVNCTVSNLAAGTYLLKATVSGKGNTAALSISADTAVSSITPTSGSIWGGQAVTLSGYGFHIAENTLVSIAGNDCTVKSATVSEIVCTTGAAGAEAVDQSVAVVTGGHDAGNTLTYSYINSATPTVTSISPGSGVSGDSVDIIGTGFSDTMSELSVSIGGADCSVSTSSTTSVTCTLSANSPGSHAVIVNVDGSGDSGSDVTFEYTLSTSAASPNSGSFGGGQKVVLAGNGFTDSSEVRICDMECEVTDVTTSSITIITPSAEDGMGSGDRSCDILVSVDGTNSTITSGYTYTMSTTPEISSVGPRRGGTMGGTKVTITGSKFGGTGMNTVTIAGVVCSIESESTTEIICTTNEKGGSAKSNVVVSVQEAGDSLLVNSEYWYIDVWSSTFTWGGNPPPTEDDFVVVTKGQLLLLDVSTPTLTMLLIQGGELLFDEADITLKSKNILITDGGRLTVGTEDEPFQHQAVIELHGFLRSPEIPIYGAKCLAVREGELNLHGKPIRMTWTRLAETATVGSDQIVLEHGQADWPVGGEIAIATTGGRTSQGETEKHTIKAISADGTIITLEAALKFEHLGQTVDLSGGHSLEMRAEVALLTRNVKVIGTNDQQWADDIEACPAGFDPGEFATQTCFQGRFGDEIGSDQFGATIMLHNPVRDQNLVRGHISFIELNYVGQAFRLGRYPIHFHLNGDMTGSYVRGVAIHKAFNRAINIHGSNNLLVEHTVIYDIMGGAFFLEDGIETGNTYMYNLALFVKASSSLLNDDITPAAFWATNPANHYLHNAVAGGTHFGWWYRMKEHPEGPSFTTDYCPRKVPLGTHYNNTAHSQGWFGIWTFQDWFPSVGGLCSSSEPEPARFEKFTVWNCEKGMEFVNAGSLQFHDCLAVNNELTGIEGKRNLQLGSSAPYTDRGPMLNNSVIVSYIPGYKPPKQRRGVTLPWSQGFSVRDTTFINFDNETEVVLGMTSIQGTCSVLCGGFNYEFSGITYINSDYIANFRWPHDGIFVDKDGSLAGSSAGSKVLPMTGTLNPAVCTSAPKFSYGVEAAICDDTVQFARLALNNPNYESMKGKRFLLSNAFGNQSSDYADKRLTHPQGWMAVVQLGESYTLSWENMEHFTNVSYSAGLFDIDGGGVIFKHKLLLKPDMVRTIAGDVPIDEASPNALSVESNFNGDFYFDENNKELSYLISDREPSSRRRRAADRPYTIEPYSMSAYRCYWPNCEPPPDQNTLPPITSRPDNWVWWSNTTIWPENRLPAEGSEVTIDKYMWVVADSAFPASLKSLVLKGNLELDYERDPTTNNYRTFKLEVDHIIIMGGRLVVGWEDNRFMGNVEIILTGDQYSPAWPQTEGTTIGQKAIAVYGGLDLHGRQRSPVHTYLAATAQAGSNTITLAEDIDWQVDEEISIAPTSYDTFETEVFRIAAVNGRTVTLNSTLVHKHLGEALTTDSGSYRLSAEVALLTRNIVVRGGPHSDMIRLGYGGRILVSSAAEDDVMYTGWARISYTQFINMGQLGFSEAFDPRFTVSYVQTGPVSSVKPSYLRGNAFHQGYSPQIGVFGAEGIKILNNVLNGFVGGGVYIQGDGHVLDSNLAMHGTWSGSYAGRAEKKNPFHEANYELKLAGVITVENNIAAGYERAGFRIHGEPCEGAAVQTPTWKGNRAHSGQIGAMSWNGEEGYPDCYKVQGFTAWKNWGWGLYFISKASVEMTDNVLLENRVGEFVLIYEPSSVAHVRHAKSVVFKRGFVSGPTQWYDCGERMPYTTSSGNTNAHSWDISGGLVGLSSANFDNGPNGIPTHPFKGRMAYPTLDGVMEISDVTFANFGTRSCSSTVRDYAFSTTPSADDNVHPTIVSSITLHSSVNENSLVFFHRANVGKVNPSDCVDMVCDGLSHALIQDTDGTFIGQPGSIVDDATYQWDGDSRYGLGDYRIPKAMLTAPNGTRLDPPQHKGIHMSSDCVYNNNWQASLCTDFKYYQLVIESMDADTEVRRLSPVAIYNEKDDYVDLLNGPQDHGWCAGYTCQRRLSTFWAVVAEGQTYNIYLSSTNPQRTRFYLINADDDVRVRLAIYYFTPQRLDVFADSVFVYPTNADISGSDYKLKTSTETPSEFLPSVTDGVRGANYFDRTWQELYVIVKGEKPVDVVIKEVVVLSLSLPPMTIDDFFGENLVSNLAVLLGVPANKIRIVNVVRETSSRRRRATADEKVELEIGDPPQAGTGVSNVNSGDLDRKSLLTITRKIVDSVQMGTFSSSLNINITSIDVQEPLPVPENSTSSDWATLASRNTSLLDTIQIPSKMVFHIRPEAKREQQPFPTQPAFAMYDVSDELVMLLGSRADPWKIRASLRSGGSNERATLIGETTCGFRNGWCNFTNLGISHSGSNYVIDFEVFDPTDAAYSDVSDSLSVEAAELTAGFYQSPSKDDLIKVNDLFTIIIDIRDKSSDMVVSDVAWTDLTWEAQLSIYKPDLSPAANLSGTLTKPVDPVTGQAVFDDVSLDTTGRYSLEVKVTSSPAQYSLSRRSQVLQISDDTVMQDELYSYNLTMKIKIDYETYAAGKEDLIEAVIYNYLQTIDNTIRYHDFVISEGSIQVLFWISGTQEGTGAVITSLSDSLSTSGISLALPDGTQSFSAYLLVDGAVYDNLDGEQTDEVEVADSNAGLTAGAIVGIVIGVLVFITIVVIIVVVIVKKKKDQAKTSPDDSETGDHQDDNQSVSQTTASD